MFLLWALCLEFCGINYYQIKIPRSLPDLRIITSPSPAHGRCPTLTHHNERDLSIRRGRKLKSYWLNSIHLTRPYYYFLLVEFKSHEHIWTINWLNSRHMTITGYPISWILVKWPYSYILLSCTWISSVKSCISCLLSLLDQLVDIASPPK
jgi:hypothetical protein